MMEEEHHRWPVHAGSLYYKGVDQDGVCVTIDDLCVKAWECVYIRMEFSVSHR